MPKFHPKGQSRRPGPRISAEEYRERRDAARQKRRDLLAAIDRAAAITRRSNHNAAE